MITLADDTKNKKTDDTKSKSAAPASICIHSRCVKQSSPLASIDWPLPVMLHGGAAAGGGSSSCASVSLGKYIRRALRGGGGRNQRVKDKNKMSIRQRPVDDGGCMSSVELIGGSSSSWSASSAAARRESVVRVVLWGGVVEVYHGVVLACTVIRRHPPGLCLAHPDVFRNPHGARVRPLEPLFPGQKFFLVPATTIQRLQRDIPEGSVGAFSDDDHDDEAVASSTEWETSTSSESQGAASWETAPAAPVGCCTRDYFVHRERWAEWKFKRMVSRGFVVQAEQSKSAAEPDTAKKRRRRRRRKKRKDVLATAPPPRKRTWEPSLPSVEEEEMPTSPDLQTPSELGQDD